MIESGLIRHIEQHLGPIDYAWKLREAPNEMSVARFRNQPYEGSTTYVTLGLSDRVLPMGDAREVRQELVFFAGQQYPGEQIASFLLTLADFVRQKNRALLRGDVIGPSDPIIPDVSCNAVYAAIPVLYDETFATCHETQPATVFVWLIPISPKEAQFIRAQGWNRFEDVLEERDPDFSDLNRATVV